MKLARSKLFVNPLAMSLVCLVATFTPVLAEASAGGKIIVEILERLLKNTDEVITKSKGGVQGGLPKLFDSHCMTIGRAARMKIGAHASSQLKSNERRVA